ncbi:uncharacterized protein LOC125249485 [Megalobrama amblycephala]|uniref:uncharacterized protein LOC125249485 n=1 Tax=Megalobrama amblycephala TaxID=75352 RepID=UPI0020141DE3|nr:uncharacterized protein LOC125249485 [Megalobrama amblycephala]
MSHLNNMSQRVLGCPLMPEFTPPGKPTDERIAVKYLLAQSNRGDQLIGDHSGMPEVPSEEPEDDSGFDATVCHAADLRAGDFDPPVDVMEAQVTSQVDDTGPKSPDAEASEEEEDDTAIPSTSGQCDSRGVLGWEAVDALATYLVGLNRTITALSSQEEANIVQLYMALHAMDNVQSKYSQRVKKKTLPGPWRASRKRSGSAPGQQAAERLFMTHGQAAQDPEVHRVCECVCLRLFKEFKQARNRPKDTRGRTLPIPQSIVMVYSHLKQLLEDSRVVLGQTNLVLVPINTTTVSSWLLRRQKRVDRDMLLQGTALPNQLYLAKEPLPEVRELPAAPAQHGHEAMEFEKPENKEGEAFIRKRISNRCPLPTPPPLSYSAFPVYPPAPHFAFSHLGSYPPILSSSSHLITCHHKLVTLLSLGSSPGEGRKLPKRMRNGRNHQGNA